MPDEKTIGPSLFAVTNLLKRRMERSVSSFGVTRSQSVILRYLELHGDEAYQRDLEAIFCIRRSSVTSLLQLMEKNGQITRIPSETDARVKKIVLTEDGKRLQSQIHSTVDETEKILRGALTQEDQEALMTALSKMNTALEREENGSL